MYSKCIFCIWMYSCCLLKRQSTRDPLSFSYGNLPLVFSNGNLPKAPCLPLVFSNGNLPEAPCLLIRQSTPCPLKLQSTGDSLSFSYGNLPPVFSNCNLPNAHCLSHTAIYPLSSQAAIYRRLLFSLLPFGKPRAGCPAIA